jgi:hypothetical protein
MEQHGMIIPFTGLSASYINCTIGPMMDPYMQYSGRVDLKNDFRELANMESSKTDSTYIHLKDILFEIFHKLEAIEDRLLQLEYAPETGEKYKEAKEHFESICPT